MSGFDLSDYNTVPERMAEALAKYPDYRFQSEIVTLPEAFADKFIAVKGRFFRTADDPTPGEGLAWEPVPGKTSFTKDSELQNAETSAWGRAMIAAAAADAKKGIASREDVRNRPTPRNADPETGEIFDPQAYAKAQVAKFKSWDEERQKTKFRYYAGIELNGKPVTEDDVDKVITVMADEYYREFPAESPFEIEGQEALDV